MSGGHCAIDFGTSNSGLAIPQPDAPGRTRLITLEGRRGTMPTAVFYFTDADEAAQAAGVVQVEGALPRAYGRAALRAYVEGHAGRLMRSLKSILGSSLAAQSTDLGDGHGVRYLDVLTGYLRHLRRLGEAEAGQALERVVLGRPVFFVDDEPERDAQAQATLAQAAQAAGFSEVRFQFEPIAAAFDYEQQAASEQRVLVADIGGGTSDFSVVRVGPARRARVDRRDDILASHGVHVAGTDFDRHVELGAMLPLLGFRARGPAATGAREVPSAVYFDLATWHLINTVYRPARVAELRAMAEFYAEPRLHARLMAVVEQRLGHELAALAEDAKIRAAGGEAVRIPLEAVERGLEASLDEAQAMAAIEADLGRIVAAALETVRLAGLAPADIDALYFTGGSTGLRPLTERLAARFPQAQAVHGDRLASVATGLGVFAARAFA